MDEKKIPTCSNSALVQTAFEKTSIRRACGHVDVGTSPHQVLAVTLTLSQPGVADYARHILFAPRIFRSSYGPASMDVSRRLRL